jgi:hypothetical protein
MDCTETWTALEIFEKYVLNLQNGSCPSVCRNNLHCLSCKLCREPAKRTRSSLPAAFCVHSYRRPEREAVLYAVLGFIMRNECICFTLNTKRIRKVNTV